MTLDFKLSEDQKKLVAQFRDFGESTFTNANVDKWTRDEGLPDNVVKAFVDLYESTGNREAKRLHTLFDRVLIDEELSRCAGATLPFQADMFNLQVTDGFANEEEFEFILGDYIKNGRLMFALAISEPQGGSDAMAMQTNTLSVDGRLILNGCKTFVNNGEYAPYIMVAAIDKDDTSGGKYPALAFWLVPRNLEGITAVPLYKIGQSMVPFASILFDNVELKPEYRLSGSEGGFRKLFQILEYARVFSCASSVGMAQAAMEDAVAHARSRKAFGTQICRFQQIEEMLTDMEVTLVNMRNMLYRTVTIIEEDSPERRLAVPLMKRYIPKAAFEVADNAMQILGGLGYTENSRVSRIWKDCRGNRLAEGTDQIMVRVAAPEIMSKYKTE